MFSYKRDMAAADCEFVKCLFYQYCMNIETKLNTESDYIVTDRISKQTRYYLP